MTGINLPSGIPWQARLKDLTDTVLNFVFPPVCVNCKKPGALLCADCLAGVPWLERPICSHCGRVVNRPMARCPGCLRHPLRSIEQVRAAVLFAGDVPDMIHQLKYNGHFALAEPLGDLMATAWPRWEMPTDMIVGVPLHPDRQKKRGYNQSDLLAAHFGRRVGLSADRRALQRVRNTPPQVGLNAADRQTNMTNAFFAERDKVAGKDILLVDDVCTTGSTLQAAAQALLDAGARRVSGYCLARAM